MIRSILFLLSFLLVFSAQAQVKTKSLDKKKWTLVESENFNIYTDLRAAKVLKIAEQLERYRAFCELYLGKVTKKSTVKLTIFMTDKRQTWKAMGLSKDTVSLFHKTPTFPALMFVDVNGFFGSSFQTANSGRSVVLNSIAQELFYDVGLNETYPQWYRIGFAYFLATYSEPRKHIMLGSLEAYHGRLAILFNLPDVMSKFDTQSLFSRQKNIERSRGMSRRSWLKKVNRFYMQSFLTLHYLYADKSRRKLVESYLKKVVNGEPNDSAFESTFAKTYSEFDSDLYKYVNARKLVASVYLRKDIEPMLSLPTGYQSKKIESFDFFKAFAPNINELDVLTSEHKALFANELKERYPNIFESNTAPL